MLDFRDELVACLDLSPDEVGLLPGGVNVHISYQELLESLRARADGKDAHNFARRQLEAGKSIFDVLLADGPGAARSLIEFTYLAHVGPFQPFTRRRVDAQKLALALDIPLSILANAFGTRARSLLDNPRGLSIQEKAVRLVAAVNAIALHTLSEHLVLLWLRTPQPAFGGLAPLDVLNEGHLDLVIGHALDIYFMTPD